MKDRKLEIFPRKYDYFFGDSEKWLSRCLPDLITLAPPYNRYRGGPLGVLDEYRRDFSAAMVEADRKFFSMAVTYLWYRLRFGYMARSYYRGDWDRNTNFAYGIFLRHFIGMEKNLYFSGAGALSVVRSYYHDFVDDAFDPRTEDVAYPYESLTIAHMAVVAEMDERLELLGYADEAGMSYEDFCDFVSNWVACYCEKYGEKYQVQLNKKGRMVEVVNLLRPGSRKGDVEYGE